MGRILAIGGGGFSMREDASPIDTYIRELTGKDRPRICFLATPTGDLPQLILDFYKVYGELGCETSHIACFGPMGQNPIHPDECKTHFLQQDAIFVSGGNAPSAIGVWKAWGMDIALREAWQHGTLLAGMSAGALCWFERPAVDPLVRYLGFLDGACEVHYDGGRAPERRTELLDTMKKQDIGSAIAIDDYAAVLYENATVDKVLSWKDGATAYQIECDDGKFVEHALPATQIGSLQPPRPPRQPVPVDPGILQAYVGRYRLMSPMIMTIMLENDRLFTQLTGQDKFEIFPEGNRDFFLKMVDAQLSFQTNDVGQVTSLLLHQHGRDTTALKMAEDHQN